MLRFHIGKMEEDRWKHYWVEVDEAAFRSIILLSVIILCGGFSATLDYPNFWHFYRLTKISLRNL